MLFIREQEKRHVVHCIDCARKQAPGLEGFVCLEEYKLSELKEVYDNFSLHSGVSRVFFHEFSSHVSQAVFFKIDFCRRPALVPTI